MRRRIIYLDYALHRGGAEVSLEMLMRALGDSFRQIVYTPEKSAIQCQGALRKYININSRILRTRRFSPQSPKTVAGIILSACNIRESGVAVSNTYKAHFAGIMMKLRGYRWIMIERDIAENPVERIMKRILYRLADRTVFVSRFAMKSNRGKGIVINNIISKGYTGKKEYIVFAGDFTHEKGFDRVARIMDDYKYNDYRYAVIGDKPHYSSDEIELPENVLHISYTRDIYSVFSRTAMLLLFNRKIESFSRVVAESMSCGAVPVVIKGNGTDDYVIDGFNGIVIDSYSYESAVNAISVIKDRKKMQSMSLNAMKTADRFNEKTIALKWKELLDSV